MRYDEELPDYILVMVVNKKSRQQMHEDLHLFLEDSTTPFVEWLHDQVLKKLQKVTVAKRKSRELVPSVIVKQEEEKKKRKAATSFLEDQEKDDKELVQSSLQLVTSTVQEEEKSPEEEISQTPPSNSIPEDLPVELPSKEKDREREREGREREESPKRRDEENDESRRLKSSVIKPRITSVVSVKTRLGVSPKVSYKDKKYDSRDLNSRHRDDKLRNFSRRGSRSEPDSTRKDLRSRLGNSKPETPKYNPVRSREKDIRDRLGQSVNQKQPKEAEKEPRNPVSRNVKNRLGPRNQNSRTETVEEEEEEEVVGPVRSRIIAVKAAPQQKTAVEENEEEEEEELVKLPSKVIVTPRPLKPLQPAQKRATKSLLFRAIAEANQSVVMQKNPEPTITVSYKRKR